MNQINIFTSIKIKIMNEKLLKEHIHNLSEKVRKEPEKYKTDFKERNDHIALYQGFNKVKILSMKEDDVYQFLSGLWAMLIWGNKHYMVDKIIADNGLQNLKNNLAELVWGKSKIDSRWDHFRKTIKGIGPAMMSEILCKTHPDDFMIWNRRAYVGLNYLGVNDLPIYDYQLTGKKYQDICEVSKKIAIEMEKVGFTDTTLLSVDYFIWDELQVERNLKKIHISKPQIISPAQIQSIEESKFIHNEVRDKLRDIGQWLGFTAKTEQKVAEGSKIDTIWEATIGNMGRVIYIFEVQTKGSIDSLLVNLLKSLNNPAVQGVVAVSDKDQLEKIEKHASELNDLKDKLKYWDYAEILQVHSSLEYVNGSINKLGLVPQGF